MTNQKNKTPFIIKLIARLGMVAAFISFIFTFNPSLKKANPYFPALLGILIAFKFISLVGLFHMKKWGVELFILTYFLIIIFAAAFKNYYQISYLGLIFNTWFLINMLFFYTRMDRNL